MKMDSHNDKLQIHMDVRKLKYLASALGVTLTAIIRAAGAHFEADPVAACEEWGIMSRESATAALEETRAVLAMLETSDPDQ